MPELTKSSVGSFAGTSELEGTMAWPLERKYSRKLERISLDFTLKFYCTAKKPGRRGRPGTRLQSGGPLRLLCVDSPVLEQPGAHRSHGALVRPRQLLQRATGVEGGEQLAVLLLGPRLAGLLRHLASAPLESLDALERRGRLVQRAHDLRALVGALGREHLPGFRIDAVRERAHDRQCCCVVHSLHPLSTHRCVHEERARKEVRLLHERG